MGRLLPRLPARMRRNLERRIGDVRARRAREGERGAVLVEAALLFPVIILVTFGLIEFSSAYQDASITGAASRSAARTASARAKQPSFATDAARAAASVIKTMPSDQPVEMWVYKANNLGYPGATGNTSFATCSTNCISYPWNPATRSFNTASPGGSGWTYTTHQACTQPFDEVGIYIRVRHKFVTTLFGVDLTLTDHAIFRLEPAPSSQCTGA